VNTCIISCGINIALLTLQLDLKPEKSLSVLYCNTFATFYYDS